MNWETLLCLGDSITQGARSYCGYPEYCGRILEKHLSKSWNVVNHATNGFTTIDLVRSLNVNFRNLKFFYPSVITIMIGTNDVKTNTAVDDFETAFSQLAVKARLLAENNNVFVFKIPQLMPKVFYPYNISMNEKVAAFNTIIEKAVSANDFRLIEAQLGEEDFFDGVHLNKEGSINVARQLAQVILKDKDIEYSPALLQDAVASL